MNDDFEILNFDLFDDLTIDTDQTLSKKRKSICLERVSKDEYRRAYSESKLLDIVDEFKQGYSYNFITSGDVDALSYIKLILRKKKTLDYMLFSTWCMSLTDINQLKEWLESGAIKKIDAYVGEIFPSSYRKEWLVLKPLIEQYKGRTVVFKNHSKIFAGYIDDFYFGIQGSANINTNPRTENACITISKDIYEFYKGYFDDIISFNVKEDII